MIRPPSFVKPYSEFWSEDASFEQLLPDATKEVVDGYNAKITVAIDTGDWSALRIAGAGEPTAFLVRPLPTDAYNRLADLNTAGLGQFELFELAFRVALVAIQNLEGAKVRSAADPRFGTIASLSWMADVGISGAMGARITREIGARILNRASNLSGKG